VFSPTNGDVLVRGSGNNGFLVTDAVTRAVLHRAPTLDEALGYARGSASGDVWQQHVDHRGRDIGPPFRVHSG
jgi:hypothetical protein